MKAPRGRFFDPAVHLVSLLLLAVLLFLLFGGSRISAVGKGLGQAVRHVKRAAAQGAEEPSAMNDSPITVHIEERRPSQPPKLLPAKGQSSASKKEGDT